MTDELFATNADGGSPLPGPPTVWVRAQRDHTYHQRTIAIGDLYLIHDHEVENIVEGLRFSRLEPPPPTAQRAAPVPAAALAPPTLKAATPPKRPR